MSKNLITGGMGLIGINIARDLLESGEEVILFDTRSELPVNAQDLVGRVDILTGDISNWVHVVGAVKDSAADCIYHSAALLSQFSEKYPSSGFRVNLEGTFNVLEAARLLGVQQVFFPASRSTFGPSSPDIVYDDTPQRPTTTYSITKLSGELMGEYYGNRYGFDYRGLRFPVIIGVGRQLSPPISDIDSIIQAAFQGKSFVSRLDPEVPINLIYVKEVIHAFSMFKEINASKLSRKTYNIKGFTITANELVETLERFVSKVSVSFKTDNSESALRLRRAMAKEMDDSLAQKEWGWQPKYFLEETVKDFLAELELLDQSS
jgi:threonine 3-dehydrogenase